MPADGGGAAPHRFQALDSLRGIAALIIAAEHLAAQGPLLGHRFFFLGSLWVDFFFVLSGFVIASAYGERIVAGFSVRKFLWLRFGRIWPVHAAVLAAYLGIELVVWLIGSTAITGRAAFGVTRAPGDFAVQLLLLQALIPTAIMTWSIPSWSISVEMLLYALAGLGWRALGRGWWMLALAMALLAGWLLGWPDLIGGYHKLLRGLCGFGLGLAVWQLWLRLGPWLEQRGRTALGVIEAALALGIIGAILRFGFMPLTLAFDLLFAAAVLVFAAQSGLLSRLLLTWPFAWLGSVSYSLYLVHPLAESVAMTAMARLAGLLGQAALFVAPPGTNRTAMLGALGFTADLAALAALLVAIAAAWAMHRLVERPAREWSRRVAGVTGP